MEDGEGQSLVFLPSRESFAAFEDVKTPTKPLVVPKPPAKTAKKPTAVKNWIGSGKGKARIASGVDLTAPTYALGK